MNVTEANSKAWDRLVSEKYAWTIPAGPDRIANARKGKVELKLTPTRFVPPGWYPDDLKGKGVLCLASGGGQQGPVFAAAGSHVTVVDISAKQLEQDRLMAEEYGLDLRTVRCSMDDLSLFDDGTFDLIFHPVANAYVENVIPVWREAYRVLAKGGVLLSGFLNPLRFLFDNGDYREGRFNIKHPIPYSDLGRDETFDGNGCLLFGHTLEDQIQGQISCGFSLTGFYEDKSGAGRPLDDFICTYMATRAVK